MRILISISFLLLICKGVTSYCIRHALVCKNDLGFFFSRMKFDKESDRKFRRTVFTKSDWRRHRSSNRYFKELINMPSSLVLKGLTLQALSISLWSVFAVTLNIIIEANKVFRNIPLLSFPPLPLSLTSPSLGLLLVFRTNKAYERWERGRSAWATVSSKSFDIMRQAVLWISDKELKAKIVRQVAAFSFCMKWKLGHEGNDRRLQEDLFDVLLPKEIEAVIESRNPVLYTLVKIGQIVTEAGLIPNVQSHIDKGICDLTDSYHTCERIYSSPIPLSYTRHTVRFLLLWLLSVPMVLYHEFQPCKGLLASIPLITFFHSIFLFGIEELGVQIEEPFGILPLANICNTIMSGGADLLALSDTRWFEGESHIDSGADSSAVIDDVTDLRITLNENNPKSDVLKGSSNASSFTFQLPAA